MFLAGILVLLPYGSALAAGQKYINVTVNGGQVSFDVQPYVDNQNRTIIPLRFVSQELGYACDWNPVTREVTVTGYGSSILLRIGQKNAEVNGQQVTMDTVAVVSGGRAMVPLRFVLENMGLSVSYDPATNTADIRNGTPGTGSGSTAGETITGKAALVTVDKLNIRSGPGTGYSILKQAVKGDILLVSMKSNDWYQVSLDGGETGWIASWLVTLRSVAELPSRGETGEDRGDTGTDPVTDPADPSTEPGISGKTIVIDPGHASLQSGGWSDPGAVGPDNVYEKDVVLAISLKVKEKLEAAGANVVMTRTGDTSLTLTGRAEVANQIPADAFVCIHAKIGRAHV